MDVLDIQFNNIYILCNFKKTLCFNTDLRSEFNFQNQIDITVVRWCMSIGFSKVSLWMVLFRFKFLHREPKDLIHKCSDVSNVSIWNLIVKSYACDALYATFASELM